MYTNVVIYIWGDFLNIYKPLTKSGRLQGIISSGNQNHVPLHEFAHALDWSMNGGRYQLVKQVEKAAGKTWKRIAADISSNAVKDEGEFFAEAFAIFMNGNLNNSKVHKAIFNFFTSG